MNLEGESKEMERRLDRSTRAETETKISGNAEIQMMQSRLNSLAEEMRMSVENGKRWADQVSFYRGAYKVQIVPVYKDQIV